MSRINKAKQKQLLEHLQEGGSLDKESLAAAIGATVKTQDSTFTAYLDSLAEEDEYLVDLEIGGFNPYGEEEAEEDAEEEEEYEAEEEEEPEPPKTEDKPKSKSKSKSKATSDDFRFFLKRDNGTSVELEKFGKSGKVVTFTEKPVTQVVSLMLKGQIIEVDLVPLRKLDQNAPSEYEGVTNAKLLALAVAAN